MEIITTTSEGRRKTTLVDVDDEYYNNNDDDDDDEAAGAEMMMKSSFLLSGYGSATTRADHPLRRTEIVAIAVGRTFCQRSTKAAWRRAVSTA
jgi:hypothetical protein